MENMASCVWTDGQHWLVGSESHISRAVAQLTTMLNQRTEAGKASHRVSSSNASLQPQVTGAFSNRQTSAVPRQPPSYQETVHRQRDGMAGNVIRQNSPSNSPSGNHHVLTFNGHQVATDNSGFASVTTHLAANIMTTSPSYHQQSFSAHQNQQFRLNGKQLARTERCENTAAAAPNRQTGYGLNTRQNNAHYAFLYLTPPTSNEAAVVQSFNKGNITGNSLSDVQISHSPNTGWKAQEYPAHLNSTNCSGGQRFTSQLLPTSTTQNQKQIQQTAARTAGYIHKSSSSSLHGFPQVDNNSLYRQKQTVNKAWMTYNNNIERATDSQTSKVSHSLQETAGTESVTFGQTSQESYQHANKQTSFNKTNQTFEHAAIYESLSDTEKLYVLTLNANYKTRQPNLYEESPKQMMSNLSSTSDSAQPNGGHSVPSSNSPRNKSLPQCADVNESLVAINMEADHSVVQQPGISGEQVTQYDQHNKCDKNNDQTDPNASYTEFSSVPAVPWTIMELTEMINHAEKHNTVSSKSSAASLLSNILSSFWNNDIKNMKSVLRTGSLRDMLTDVNEFCAKHLTRNAVILSEAKCSFKNHKRYRVLKDEEVYSEIPYKSSWLNVNKQLDDIDKEFGFPWSFLYRHCISDNKPDVTSVSQIPEQIETQVSNEVLPGNKHKLAEEETASTVKTLSIETASVEEESATSNDSYYSFNIEVLPPEEARIIFEQLHSHKPQSMDTDSTQTIVTNISEDDQLPEATCVKLNDTNEESASVDVVEQLCCLSRWLATVCGLNDPLLNKCQCKNEQKLKDATERPFNEEEMAVQVEDGLCVISLEDKLPIEKETQGTCGENEMSTCNPSALDINLSNTTEIISESEPQTHSSETHSDNEPSNTSQISNIQPNNNDSEHLSNTKAKTPSDSDMDCSVGCLESVKSTQSYALVSTDNEPESHPSSKSDVGHQILDNGETYEPLISTNVTETSEEVKKTSQMISPTAFPTPSCLRSKDGSAERNHKRQSSPKRLYPIFKKSQKRNMRIRADSQPSKCSNGLIDVTLAPKVSAFQLVPFGSSRPDKPVFHGGRNSHLLSAQNFYNQASVPPEVLSVKLSPLKRDSNENVRPGEPSVKQRLFEKWRLSLPPPKLKGRSKVKSQRNTLARATVKELEMVCPTNIETVPASSETKIRGQNSTLRSNRKRKLRSSFGRRGCKQREKTTKDFSAFAQPAYQESSNTEVGISFSVLPDTFNFNKRSSKRRKTSDIKF